VAEAMAALKKPRFGSPVSSSVAGVWRSVAIARSS
jgi:hypothetical protein